MNEPTTLVLTTVPPPVDVARLIVTAGGAFLAVAA